MLSRRKLITGLISLATAPAIVRVESLMPVKVIDLYDTRCLYGYDIASDRMILRIDRCLNKLKRPANTMIIEEVPLHIAKILMGKHPIFKDTPNEGEQTYTYKEISNAALLAAGFRSRMI